MGKVTDKRTTLPPNMERATQYTAGTECVVTAAPMCGGLFEFEIVGPDRPQRKDGA